MQSRGPDQGLHGVRRFYGASVSKVTYKAWRTTPSSSARFCRALRPNAPRPLERPPESSMTELRRASP